MLSTVEAADELGVTPRRVLALIQSGSLPATRVGSRWVIMSDSLDSVRDRKPGRKPKLSD